MTTWVHGAEETARVEEASRIMFGGSLDGVQERTLELLAKVVPVVDIDATELANGIAIVDLLEPYRRGVEERRAAAPATRRRLHQQRPRHGRRAQGRARPTWRLPTMLVVRGGRKDYRLVRTAPARASK